MCRHEQDQGNESMKELTNIFYSLLRSNGFIHQYILNFRYVDCHYKNLNNMGFDLCS